jgi:hypothetical protein
MENASGNMGAWVRGRADDDGMDGSSDMTDAFARTYSTLTRWIATHGWIELGDDGVNRSVIRILDEGGLIWEGGAGATVDDALRAAETAIAIWMHENLDG